MALNNPVDAAATDATWRKSYERKGRFFDPPRTIHLWRSPDGNGSRCGMLRDRAPTSPEKLTQAHLPTHRREPQHATWQRGVVNCADCLHGPEAPAVVPPSQTILAGAAALLAQLDGRKVA